MRLDGRLGDAIDSFADELQPGAAIPDQTGSSASIVKPLIAVLATANAVLLGYYYSQKNRKPQFSDDVIDD